MLSGKYQLNFSKKFKTELRSDVKIDKDYVEQFNKDWKTSGQFYEIDEKATAERNEKLNGSDNSNKKSVADTVAEINAAEKLEDLMPYEEDTRKGVQKAMEAKKEEFLN